MNFEVGDIVRITSLTEGAEDFPEYYPSIGTQGKVTKVDEFTLCVQWPQGSTSGDDNWWIEKECVETLYSNDFSCRGALLFDCYTHDERVAFLRKLDAFARDRLDEEYFINNYLAIAIPDDSSDEDFEEYAEDATLIMDTLYEIVNGIINNYIEEEH